MITKAKITEFLKNPLTDKFFGAFVILPAVYVLFQYCLQIQAGQFDWFHLGIAANMAVIVVTTLFRRTAKRISLNPIFWLITLLRTFWAFVILNYVYVYSQPVLAPIYVVNGLLVLSMVLIVYSRLSLGRNIGFIPAKRELVTTGAYGWVRHPIHTAEFIFFTSFILQSYTPFNAFMLTLGIIFVAVKSITEERFFDNDEEYQAYKKKVQWLWIPYVI